MRHTFPRGAAAALLLTALVGAGCLAPRTVRSEDHIKYAWVQLGQEAQSLRAIVSQHHDCPTAVVDGREQPMSVRAEPSDAHPVRSCELAVPYGAGFVTLGGRNMPLLAAGDPGRVVVMGDTGCRLKKDDIQNCSKTKDWPWKWVADQAAAEPGVGLVIHVGDYHYRENPNCGDDKTCQKEPKGYNWPSWEADFFQDGAKLLGAAPWVMMRGNHETCARAGDGWFRYLDPHPYNPVCQQFTDSYTISLGERKLLVVDSADVDQSQVIPEQVAHFTQQFAQVFAAGGDGPNWLLVHHPLWNLRKGEVSTVTLQQAADHQLPKNLQAVIVGHHHVLRWMSFDNSGAANGRPPILISGNGGTELSGKSSGKEVLVGKTIDGVTVAAGETYRTFGYLVLERQGNGWRVAARNDQGETFQELTLENKQLTPVQ